MEEETPDVVTDGSGVDTLEKVHGECRTHEQGWNPCSLM